VTAISEAASPSLSEAPATVDGEAAPPAGKRTTALLLATLLMLGVAGVLGYTQWWVPREQAQQVAQVKYERCKEEVKAYLGKDSYADRLSQCTKFLSE
jgi:predicted negative regulator of RcsB-dependent stress response